MSRLFRLTGCSRVRGQPVFVLLVDKFVLLLQSNFSLMLPENFLFAEVKSLIVKARHSAARAVNAELVLLYWQIGHKIRHEILLVAGARSL